MRRTVLGHVWSLICGIRRHWAGFDIHLGIMFKGDGELHCFLYNLQLFIAQLFEPDFI
jgi:hypothetical protein